MCEREREGRTLFQMPFAFLENTLRRRCGSATSPSPNAKLYAIGAAWAYAESPPSQWRSRKCSTMDFVMTESYTSPE